MKILTIETNHGRIKLADVEIETINDCIVAVGTVESSYQISRLDWATSSREVYPKGQRVSHDIYRMPDCTDKESDRWFVSTVTCG